MKKKHIKLIISLQSLVSKRLRTTLTVIYLITNEIFHKLSNTVILCEYSMTKQIHVLDYLTKKSCVEMYAYHVKL